MRDKKLDKILFFMKIVRLNYQKNQSSNRGKIKLFYIQEVTNGKKKFIFMSDFHAIKVSISLKAKQRPWSVI